MGSKLTREDVQEILAILDGSSFDELQIETDDLKISLRRSGAALPESMFSKPRESRSPADPPAAVRPSADLRQDQPAPAATGDAIAAPMLGVFFRAPRPGAEPYVEVGSRIAPDSIVGIIEVMKFMNPVTSGVAGEVLEIPAPDGQLVEFGQTLVRVRPD